MPIINRWNTIKVMVYNLEKVHKSWIALIECEAY